jgi:hypothetical protein
MRLVIAVCLVLLFSVLACGQAPVHPGYYGYGYGPYVPLVTTPEVSLQQVSPNPVGASNATHGLLAGARNSTLEMINGNTSSTYTVPVWYSGGGAPLISTPEVSLFPRPLHAGHIGTMEEPRREEREARAARAMAWIYFASPEETSSAVEAAGAARSAKRATHVYTNQDVENENQKNGLVKYDGKTEKIQ